MSKSSFNSSSDMPSGSGSQLLFSVLVSVVEATPSSWEGEGEGSTCVGEGIGRAGEEEEAREGEEDGSVPSEVVLVPSIDLLVRKGRYRRKRFLFPKSNSLPSRE
jgi:hypothetical protein